jgi:hypothetical protein
VEVIQRDEATSSLPCSTCVQACPKATQSVIEIDQPRHSVVGFSDMACALSSVPSPPKGMWTRTYGCLLDEILQAEMLADEAQANRFQRLFVQIEDDLE